MRVCNSISINANGVLWRNVEYWYCSINFPTLNKKKDHTTASWRETRTETSQFLYVVSAAAKFPTRQSWNYFAPHP